MSRAAAIVLAALLAAGCSSGDSAARWVEQVQSVSAEADRALAAGEGDAARSALERLLRLDAPRSVAADDARVVAQDAAWRLALLALESGAPEDALRWADDGLARGRTADLFQANLLAARGRAYEALGRDADAARDYHAALLVNEALLNDLLTSTQKEAPR